MSVLRYGAPCEPAGQLMTLDMVTDEPTHTGCSGGWSMPGLIGGWTCPCDCHRPSPAVLGLRKIEPEREQQ